MADMQYQYGTVPTPTSAGDGLERSESSHFYVPEDKAHEKLNGIAPANVHNAFIRKVYGLLAVELAFTAAVVAFICLVPSIREPLVSFALHRRFTYQLLMLVALVSSMCWLMLCQQHYPMNMFALAAFVFVMSIDVGWICAYYYASGQGTIILIAVLITFVIFVALTIYAWVTTVDFSYWIAFLLACTCALLLVAIVQLFVHMEALYIAYCCLGIMIFSGWIIIDTSLIKQKLHCNPDRAIEASIQLYLDIINLFLFILSLLGNRR
jgi:hypothetical protein